jgi:hypothetical protein
MTRTLRRFSSSSSIPILVGALLPMAACVAGEEGELAQAVTAEMPDRDSESDLSPYLIVRLTGELFFKESAGGIAGARGRIWSIQPDGAWSVSSFKTEEGKQVSSPLWSDRLTRVQIEKLATELARGDLLKIAPSFGPEPSDNPHIYTLRLGKVEKQLRSIQPHRAGTAGENIRSGWIIEKGEPPMTEEEKRDLDHFAVIADAIESATVRADR